MKKLSILLISVFIVMGCASTSSYTKPVNMPFVLAEAVNLSQDSNMQYFEIPSRGSIADAASIAVNGGGAAKQLKDILQKLGQSENGSIVITSMNPVLPVAHLRGALSEITVQLPNLLLIYAGDVQYSDEIEAIAKSKGLKYGFIDMTNSP